MARFRLGKSKTKNKNKNKKNGDKKISTQNKLLAGSIATIGAFSIAESLGVDTEEIPILGPLFNYMGDLPDFIKIIILVIIIIIILVIFFKIYNFFKG